MSSQLERVDTVSYLLRPPHPTLSDVVPHCNAVNSMLVTRMSHSMFRYQPPPPTAARSPAAGAATTTATAAAGAPPVTPARAIDSGRTAAVSATPFALEMKTPARTHASAAADAFASPGSMLMASPASPAAAAATPQVMKRDAGRTLVTAGRDATIHLYDISTPFPRQLRVLEGHTEWVTDVAWVSAASPAPNTAAAATASTAAGSAPPRTPPRASRTLPGSSSLVDDELSGGEDDRALGTGVLVSCSADTLIKVWNVSDGVCVKTVSKHTDYIECLSYSPHTNLLVSGGFDNQLYLWRLDDALSFPCESLTQHYTENAGSYYACHMNESGSCLVTASSDRVIRYWDLRVGASAKPIKLVAHSDNIKSIALSQDGTKCLSASSDRTIRLWDLGEQRCVATYTPDREAVWTVAVSADFSRCYSGGPSRRVTATDLLRSAESGSTSHGSGAAASAAASASHAHASTPICAFDHPIVALHLDESNAKKSSLWVSTADSLLTRWDVPSTSTLADSDRDIASLRTSLPFDTATDSAATNSADALNLLSALPTASVASHAAAAAHPPAPSAALCSSIVGVPALKKYRLLHDGRHALVLDVSGRVHLFDIVQSILVRTYGASTPPVTPHNGTANGNGNGNGHSHHTSTASCGGVPVCAGGQALYDDLVRTAIRSKPKPKPKPKPLPAPVPAADAKSRAASPPTAATQAAVFAVTPNGKRVVKPVTQLVVPSQSPAQLPTPNPQNSPNLSQWCSIDVRLGCLCVYLERKNWAAAELYLVPEMPSDSEELALYRNARVNLGELALRLMFAEWLALEKRSSDEKRIGSRQSSFDADPAIPSALAPSHPPQSPVPIIITPAKNSKLLPFFVPSLSASTRVVASHFTNTKAAAPVSTSQLSHALSNYRAELFVRIVPRWVRIALFRPGAGRSVSVSKPAGGTDAILSSRGRPDPQLYDKRVTPQKRAAQDATDAAQRVLEDDYDAVDDLLLDDETYNDANAMAAAAAAAVATAHAEGAERDHAHETEQQRIDAQQRADAARVAKIAAQNAAREKCEFVLMPDPTAPARDRLPPLASPSLTGPCAMTIRKVISYIIQTLDLEIPPNGGGDAGASGGAELPSGPVPPSPKSVPVRRESKSKPPPQPAAAAAPQPHSHRKTASAVTTPRDRPKTASNPSTAPAAATTAAAAAAASGLVSRHRSRAALTASALAASSGTGLGSGAAAPDEVEYLQLLCRGHVLELDADLSTTRDFVWKPAATAAPPVPVAPNVQPEVMIIHYRYTPLPPPPAAPAVAPAATAVDSAITPYWASRLERKKAAAAATAAAAHAAAKR